MNKKILRNITPIVENDTCSGCGVCVGACPFDVISIGLSKDGFFRPLVNEETCTDCTICLKICSATEENKNKLIDDFSFSYQSKNIFGKVNNVYASWHLDKKIRYDSASGGLATAITQWGLKNNYVVAGTGYEEGEIKTKSFIAKNSEESKGFISSKYMPSDYSQIAEYIRKNKKEKIIVIGLPCQIASIRNMIKYKRENIILVDIFCGRINSNALIEKYVHENDFNNSNIEFRDKSSSWYNYSISLKNKYKDKKELFRESLFGQFLNSKLMTQNACYDCVVGSAGVADITLGDFWNEKKYGQEKDGVSIVVTRTILGEKLISQLDNVYFKEEPKEELGITQPHFFTKEQNKQYLKDTNKEVLKDMNNMTLQELSDKYIYNTFKKKLKRDIKKLIRKFKK